MAEDSRAALAAVKKQFEYLNHVKAELPRLREKLGEDLFQFDRLEARVNELDAQVRSLESFSLASIASSLSGRKQQKLMELKEELAPLTEKYSADIEALNALNEQVQRMEKELEKFYEIEKEYERACNVLAETVREQGGDLAGDLADIDDHFQQVKTEHRLLTKAIEAAEQTERHLDSITRSLGNAKKKMLYRSPLGAVGQVVHHVYTQKQTQGPIRLVAQGVERLKGCIDNLPLEEDIPINRELRRLSLSLAEIVSGLSAKNPTGHFFDMSFALPIRQYVREAQNHCTHLRDELQPQLEALEQQRRAVIESVA